ncbi:ribosome biogenesis GTPase YlqF [Companilactobacillus sp.]|jgi:ribosome biogenesis GTPase A|uniref:ribosome biogenesis GTPase YlqF n=1 Tax=Companilactobacillus sp. TaxID=2767905 RepID=UPI0025BA44DF|nr:ribosome biogenesis GTPase YlqF [Companilactobacillus sp.]MCH4008298.1 ribosome biogenesis GTPase YlqF [Companilactobacillus sp.]MCH4051523.1 ribosome biogenesis GTPase YlqF [Companilactobacillus sp.]MCH4076241.1 ribosome biogenesis GTPase YlqF [Companilactobacillus sp.]MCH4124816.1 ribosome biogenesis GTPase YlqF [Companilactobacillus sp.]MCH4131358.1 ribosome biogenesis GTPase YlqF [Companilactobacillus sp.]
MALQWYPGHMNKAKNQVQDRLKVVDIVLEIVDARLPYSSRNPVLEQIINQKKHIIILNKSDLADPKLTSDWILNFKQEGTASIESDAKHDNKLAHLNAMIRSELSEKIAKYERNGVKNYQIKAMCVGIPNVGKSTILNKMVGKNVAVTGNKPGVTKNQNWLKTNYGIDLLDTPGILWPKITDPKVGMKLALSGAIKDKIYPPDDVAIFALNFLETNYLERVMSVYNLERADIFNHTTPELLMNLTKKFGYKEDYDRASRKIIMDVRNLKFGRLTFDVPGEFYEE